MRCLVCFEKLDFIMRAGVYICGCCGFELDEESLEGRAVRWRAGGVIVEIPEGCLLVNEGWLE